MGKFEAILDEMRQIHQAKRTDYANSDVFGNFREAERVGVPAHKGAFIRLSDKYRRCCNLLSGQNQAVKDESVEDTLLDLAVYAVITLGLYQEQVICNIWQEQIQEQENIGNCDFCAFNHVSLFMPCCNCKWVFNVDDEGEDYWQPAPWSVDNGTNGV